MVKRGTALVPTKLRLLRGETRPVAGQPNRATTGRLAAHVRRTDAHSEPTVLAPGASEDRADTAAPVRRLAKPLETERSWVPDREAMRAALRVVLGLPMVLPSPAGGGEV